MAEKYLTLADDGRDTLIEATTMSTGTPQGGKIPALDPDGKLNLTFFPSSVLTDNVKALPASEALSAGKFVNVFYDPVGAAWKVRLADNSNDRRAMGFVRAAVAQGATAMVYFEGDNTQVAGLVNGRVFLGTAGGVTQTAPKKAAGAVISQFLGAALSATEMDVQIADEIVL